MVEEISTGKVSPRTSNETPENLFTGRSIEEIGQIERKIRGDIERKREELRQMVGERYRDLIEAADTITSMKQHSLKIISNIERLKKLQSNPQGILVNQIPDKENVANHNKQMDETTATIKLLTVLPDRIAKIIERREGQFTHASMCYLLGNHLTAKLGLDSPASAILAVIPIINSKVNLLDSSKRDLNIILMKILESPTITQDQAVDALRALAMISENFDYMDIFIRCRNSGLSSLIEMDSTDPEIQMSQVGSHLKITIELFHTLFMDSVTSPLFEKSQLKVTEIIGARSELWTRFLPKSIFEWSSVEEPTYSVPSNISEIVDKWLQTSRNTILEKLPSKLSCIKSGEDLNALRSNLENSITPSSRDSTQLGEWMIVVNRVFERNIDFRKFFFDEPFNSRLCEIITNELDEIQEATNNLLRVAILDSLRDNNYDFSISSSIWTRRDDGDQNVDWAKKNLSLRAKSFHPAIVSGIHQASCRFKKLLPDVKSFTSDKKILKQQTRKFVENFCKFCSDFQNEENATPERSLVIGRCAYALAELCQELQNCLADEWQEAREMLISQGDNGVTAWVDSLAVQCGRKYFQSFPEIPNESILGILPILTGQNVTEENESGETIESQISVPQSISISLSNALGFQARQMNKNGAHSLKKSQLRQHVKKTATELYSALTEILDQWESQSSQIHQPVSLQLLFDLKFIGLITGTALEKNYSTLDHRIEQMIDPLDLAVLSSHIQVNSNKAIQKTNILHGHVSVGVQTSKSMATSTTNEKHNILKLSEVTARFSTLPTPTINTKTSVRQVVAKNRNANRKIESENLTTQVFSKIGGLSSWFGKE